MSACPSSTVEQPWDITELSTLHHLRMGKWNFYREMSWVEGNSSRRAMFLMEDVKWAKLPSEASHVGQIRSYSKVSPIPVHVVENSHDTGKIKHEDGVISQW